MPGDATCQMAVLNALADGECLTIDALADRAGLTRRQVSNAAARLIGRALVVRVETGCFRATGDGLVALAKGVEIKCGSKGPERRDQPRRNTLNTRLWRAMRVMGKFTIPGLLELAARDEKHAEGMAGRYLRSLERAGYVLRLSRRTPGTSPTSNGYVRWSLIKDTGVLPPMVRQDGSVQDPNTGEVVPCIG